MNNTKAQLTYPIALMTADEISYAGGVWTKNAATWYYLNSKGNASIKNGQNEWWLLSAASWDTDKSSVVFKISSAQDRKAQFGAQSVQYKLHVRPVISLKKDLIYKSGDGSATSPYTIEEVADPKLTDVIKTNTVNENGYRYEGTNPNNYIYMTNKSTNEKELWRIIGIFNDGANGEEVIRVRRHYEKDSYPTMAYDSNKTNHFPNTTMHDKLSSTYNLTNYSHTVNYKMYLGTSSSYSSLTSSAWFEVERGSTPGVTAKNNYNSSTSFIGSVGLIYPSDYGYAVLASDCPRTKETNSYHNLAACHNNNWLYQGDGIYQWLLSPSSSYANGAYYVDYRGLTNNDLLSATDDVPHFNGVQNLFPTIPVMALSADVTVSGTGTQSDPYVMTN